MDKKEFIDTLNQKGSMQINGIKISKTNKENWFIVDFFEVYGINNVYNMLRKTLTKENNHE